MYRVRYLDQNDKMSQQVRLKMFEQVYPAELLHHCVQHSPMRQQKRRRLRHFTARSRLWFLLAMVLWSRLAQKRVWDKLTHWLQDRYPQQPEDPAGASALSYQRTALGVEPLQWLFEQGTHLLCTPETPGAFYRSHRLMALDGSLFNVPDTEANAQAFGRSCNQYGKGAYPQARAVMLTECGSHATVGLHLGMLLMHDANFFGGAYLEALNAKGVRALFALPSTVALQRVRNLPDGSYLARLTPQRRAVYPMQQPLWLRIIEYQVSDERLGEPGHVYRLGTTWLNPRTAPAKELLALYHERWEIEIVVDEIKTHEAVCSRRCCVPTPHRGCERRLYALFVVHYAIRALMYCSALLHGWLFLATLIGDRFANLKNRLGKTQAIGIQIGLQGRAIHQGTDGIMHHKQRVKSPFAPPVGCGNATPSAAHGLVRFDLVDHDLNLPAFMIEGQQLFGRSCARIEPGGAEPIHVTRLNPRKIGRA